MSDGKKKKTKQPFKFCLDTTYFGEIENLLLKIL